MEKDKERFFVAFDMDGTLLRHDNTVGEESKRIIKELVERGHCVSIASGRPDRVITPYWDELGMNGPVVCYNGSKVYMPHNPSFQSYKRMFPKQILLDFMKQFGYSNFVDLMAENDTTLYINKDNSLLDDFYHTDGMIVKKGNLLDILDSDSYILIIGMNTHDLDERLVRCAFSFPQIGLRFWGGAESRFCELYFLDTSKTTGIEHARNFLNLDHDHVVVIGDADNDVEMLTEYPNSIAMINGEKQVKERARYMSDFDNEHDGAAKAVLKLINKLTGREQA